MTAEAVIVATTYAVAFALAYFTHSFLLIFAFIGVIASLFFVAELLRDRR